MLSIYIHIPFCIKKCNYCGFISFANKENEIDNYISALEKEIKLYSELNKINEEQVDSIFFGGGTPSILSIKQIEKILNNIKKYFNIIENCEITIECNPATNIDFMGLKLLGFNRISIGVQSFNDLELIFLERLHNSQVAINTILKAKKYFYNVNIDLIYGIPNQTLNSFSNNINKFLSFDLPHISAYNLIYEPETRLSFLKENSANNIKELDADLELEMYDLLCSKLTENGFKQYEVSNFSLLNYSCRHNKHYWNRYDYIGFGIAAHSCINDIRFSNTDNFSNYFKYLSNNQLPTVTKEILSSENIEEEKIFLGLRSKGIEKELLNNKQLQFIQECIKIGYCKEEKYLFVLTSRGKFITDSIVLNILKRK